MDVIKEESCQFEGLEQFPNGIAVTDSEGTLKSFRNEVEHERIGGLNWILDLY